MPTFPPVGKLVSYLRSRDRTGKLRPYAPDSHLLHIRRHPCHPDYVSPTRRHRVGEPRAAATSYRAQERASASVARRHGPSELESGNPAAILNRERNRATESRWIPSPLRMARRSLKARKDLADLVLNIQNKGAGGRPQQLEPISCCCRPARDQPNFQC